MNIDAVTTVILNENKKLRELLNTLSDKNLELEKENVFLQQRNKDLRQKTWYNVYEENMQLTQQLEKYKHMIDSIEKFIGEHDHGKR